MRKLKMKHLNKDKKKKISKVKFIQTAPTSPSFKPHLQPNNHKIQPPNIPKHDYMKQPPMRQYRSADEIHPSQTRDVGKQAQKSNPVPRNYHRKMQHLRSSPTSASSIQHRHSSNLEVPPPPPLPPPPPRTSQRLQITDRDVKKAPRKHHPNKRQAGTPTHIELSHTSHLSDAQFQAKVPKVTRDYFKNTFLSAECKIYAGCSKDFNNDAEELKKDAEMVTYENEEQKFPAKIAIEIPSTDVNEDEEKQVQLKKLSFETFDTSAGIALDDINDGNEAAMMKSEFSPSEQLQKKAQEKEKELKDTRADIAELKQLQNTLSRSRQSSSLRSTTSSSQRRSSNKYFRSYSSARLSRTDTLATISSSSSSIKNRTSCATHGLEKCDAFDRAINMLKYYKSVDIINSEHDRNKLMKLYDEWKDCMLDDYMHIITVHTKDEDLLKMEDLAHRFAFRCDHITLCDAAKRHWGEDRKESLALYIEDKFNYFIGVMDRLHCYVFHLHSVGLRITRERKETSMNIPGAISHKKKEIRKLFGSVLERLDGDKFNVKLQKRDEIEGNNISMLCFICHYCDFCT